MQLPHLYLITDGARIGENRLLEALQEASKDGLKMVQIREKQLSNADLESLLRRVLQKLPREMIVIMNAYSKRCVDLVETLDLDGVHLGGDPASITEIRGLLSKHRLVGYSAHSKVDVRLACELGADYVSYSPIYSPNSKTNSLPPVGIDALREVCRDTQMPVYALGGVTAGRVAEIKDTGAYGVGVIGAILDADAPGTATREILEGWNNS